MSAQPAKETRSSKRKAALREAVPEQRQLNMNRTPSGEHLWPVSAVAMTLSLNMSFFVFWLDFY
ncbi:MAG: hypothetical protein ACOY4W_04320 [Thermodesulfobacteriota bacterium]